MDQITFLHPLDAAPLRKVWRDGVAMAYPKASRFRAEVVPVDGLPALARALYARRESGCCAVSGELVPGTDPRDIVRRSRTPPVTLRDTTHYWAVLDFDSALVEAWPAERVRAAPLGALAALRAALPADLCSAGAVAHLTASAGVKDGVRARFWVWLTRAISSQELRAWLSHESYWGRIRPDPSLGRPCQPIYLCDPVFA